MDNEISCNSNQQINPATPTADVAVDDDIDAAHPECTAILRQFSKMGAFPSSEEQILAGNWTTMTIPENIVLPTDWKARVYRRTSYPEGVAVVSVCSAGRTHVSTTPMNAEVSAVETEYHRSVARRMIKEDICDNHSMCVKKLG